MYQPGEVLYHEQYIFELIFLGLKLSFKKHGVNYDALQTTCYFHSGPVLDFVYGNLVG
jgi:hypothetical protein